MARPTDWSPLYDSDPTPGDPDTVRDLASRYSQTAQAIQDASTKLRTISGNGTDGWFGKSASGFRSKASGVADNIDKGYDRYNGTAQALYEFLPEMESAQATTLRALTMAQQAQAAQQHAQTAKQTAQSAVDAATDPKSTTHADLATHQSSLDTANASLTSANTDLASAKKLADGGKSQFDDAGDKAASKVDDASQGDKDHHSWWDSVCSFLQKVGEWAGKIAGVLGVLSLVLGWVPILGQVLDALTLIASAVALVCDLTVAITSQIETGHADWFGVAMDVVGVASFGVGRVLTKGAKVATEMQYVKDVGAAKSLEEGGATVREFDEASNTYKDVAATKDSLMGGKVDFDDELTGGGGGLTKRLRSVEGNYGGAKNNFANFKAGYTDVLKNGATGVKDGATGLAKGAKTLVTDPGAALKGVKTAGGKAVDTLTHPLASGKQLGTNIVTHLRDPETTEGLNKIHNVDPQVRATSPLSGGGSAAVKLARGGIGLNSSGIASGIAGLTHLSAPNIPVPFGHGKEFE